MPLCPSRSRRRARRVGGARGGCQVPPAPSVLPASGSSSWPGRGDNHVHIKHDHGGSENQALVKHEA